MRKTIGFAMIVIEAAWCVLVAGCSEPLIQPATRPSTRSAKELTLDLGNKVTIKLVLIPAGKFMMGSPDGEKGRSSGEGPQHEVTISKPFYMGVYEVTQEQYEQIIGKNPSEFKGAANPVETVSWDEAVDFCKKLSAKTGKTVSLPTEAQWEYACRAGSKTRFSFGDADADLCKYGNYCDKSNTDGFGWQDKDHNDGFDKTAPVGSLKPNAWGLYDMHGNVWEWCSDWYADSYANAKNQDPQGPDSGTMRVLRGGCWGIEPRHCQSANRGRFIPDSRNYFNFGVGFRVVVHTLPPGFFPVTPDEFPPVKPDKFPAPLPATVISDIDQSLAKAAMFLANAKKISDLDNAEVNVREGKKLLDANRQSLSPEEYAKQLSKINDLLREIVNKRRALAETKAEGQ